MLWWNCQFLSLRFSSFSPSSSCISAHITNLWYSFLFQDWINSCLIYYPLVPIRCNTFNLYSAVLDVISFGIILILWINIMDNQHHVQDGFFPSKFNPLSSSFLVPCSFISLFINTSLIKNIKKWIQYLVFLSNLQIRNHSHVIWLAFSVQVWLENIYVIYYHHKVTPYHVELACSCCKFKAKYNMALQIHAPIFGMAWEIFVSAT